MKSVVILLALIGVSHAANGYFDGSAIITHFSSNPYDRLHCTAQTQAVLDFEVKVPTSGPAADNIENGMWAAVNANNLRTGGKLQGAYPGCGMCVAYKTIVDGQEAKGGPIVIADQCAECEDNHLDLSDPAWDELRIGPVNKVDSRENANWEHTMLASWAFVSCDGSNMPDFLTNTM